MKKNHFKAFTMAEAILVMTILGVIAAVMITVLKPVEFKEKALALLAKKAIYEIDSATMQIIANHSADGTMLNLFLDDTNDRFAFNEDYEKLKELYGKYLAFTRKEYVQGEVGFEKLDELIASSPNAFSKAPPIFLKDGMVLYLGLGEVYNLQLSQTTQPIAIAAAKIDYNLQNEKLISVVTGCMHECVCTKGEGTCNSMENMDNPKCTIGDYTMPDGNICNSIMMCDCSNKDDNNENFDILECSYNKNTLIGMMFMDINGIEEPNVPYADQFYIPVGKTGIDWEQFCFKKPN